MKKKLDTTLIITTTLCLLPFILGFIVYERLPEQLAIHFDSTGNPDNYASKNLVVFGLPLLMALINGYAHFRLNNDPKRQNASAMLKMISKWLVPIVSVIFIPITLFIALGAGISIPVIATAIVGVIIVICGNYLPKCRRNYTIGIKLSWTLDNEENWNKTHHFAGFIWVIGGLVFTANAFLSLWYVGIAILALLVATPIIYSFTYYKKQMSKGSD